MNKLCGCLFVLGLVVFAQTGNAACPADTNSDDVVDTNDLVAVIVAWGPCVGGCAADVNGDEVVDTNDLVAVIVAWGPCPLEAPVVHENSKVDGSPLGGHRFGDTVAIHGMELLVSDVGNSKVYLLDAGSGAVLDQWYQSPLGDRVFGIDLDLNNNVIAIARNQGISIINDPGNPRNGHPVYPGQVHTYDPSTGAPLHVYTADTFDARRFGESAAVAGDKLIVGAPGTDDDNNLGVPIEGVVYVYDSNSGAQLRSFTPSDFSGISMEQYGAAVAIEGDLAVVGAPGHNVYRGGVYVYSIASGQEIVHLENPHDSNDFFGASVAIENGVIAIGAPYGASGGIERSGAAYLYQVSTGQLIQLPSVDLTPGDRFGWDIAFADENVVAGAPNAHSTDHYDDDGNYDYSSADGTGNAYVYNAVDHTLIAVLEASDGAPWAKFGTGVDLDNGTVIAGSPGDNYNDGYSTGSVYLFEL